MHALQFIKEMEDHERFKKLGPKLAAGQLSTEERQWWNQRYPEVPDSVLKNMVDKTPECRRVRPWNRRVRKRLNKAKGVIIHLFARSRQSAREWQKGNYRWSTVQNGKQAAKPSTRPASPKGRRTYRFGLPGLCTQAQSG